MKKQFLITALLLSTASLTGCSYLPTWLGGSPTVKAKLPGERITVLPEGASIQPNEAIKNTPVNLPPATENADWQQHTGNVTAATANLALKGTLAQSSHASIGEGEEFHHVLIPQPVVAGGRVYAMDATGAISAHEAGNISHVLWKSKGVSEKHNPDVVGGGLAFDQGKLYAVSGRGMVAAINAEDGSILWSKSVKTPFRSAPKVIGGKVIAVTIDNETFAFSAASGDTLWDQRGINETAGLMNSVSPAADGDIAIVPYSSGEIYALAVPDGHETWNASLVPGGGQTEAGGDFSGIGGDPVIDGQVVFAVSNGNSLSVFALTSGQKLWENPISSINTPWVAGDYIYVLTSDNTLVCFMKYTGAVRWATKLPTYMKPAKKELPITWKGPVMVAGSLAVTGSHQQLTLVSAADGSITRSIEIPENVYTSPVVAGGRMYLVSQDATLYELQ